MGCADEADAIVLKLQCPPHPLVVGDKLVQSLGSKHGTDFPRKKWIEAVTKGASATSWRDE